MKHACHAQGCTRVVPPSKFMCFRHWHMLGPVTQASIWKHYRKGQETDKQPSQAYLNAAKNAIEQVRRLEEQRDRADARHDLKEAGLL